ncbi:integrase catalytic subunit [Caballeronia novacaledonica]|uniref:Integrase catalytic subunit n=1 Tax=Caballeronia novacaledonica TaxID=1544861 RepID=A0A2U3I2X5_9BURK|nr:hypothetical protein [Caballeronia novacaledonica]SPB14490.1 integrase catalytic subunit [Caballeronia novacaledonica]
MLSVQYDRVLYLLDDTLENRRLSDRYVDVREYPDGRTEIRANGRLIVSRAYDRLAAVDQGAIIEHKRLAHALEISQALQPQRDNRRIGVRRSGRKLVCLARRSSAKSRRRMLSK